MNGSAARGSEESMTKEIGETLKPGDVVQLDPTACKNPMFGACFMTVTEVRGWGCQGYVQALGENGKIGGQAYYRATWDEVHHIGHAEFTIGIEEHS